MYLLRRHRPSWRDRIDQVERYAHMAFAAVELGAGALGLSGPAAKLAAYLAHLEELVRGAGLPWGRRERDHAEKLAEGWALSLKPPKTEAELGAIAMKQALDELGRVADRVNAWIPTIDERLGNVAMGELGKTVPPSMRDES